MPYSDRGLKFSLEGIIILGIVDLRSAVGGRIHYFM